jgi:predicted N-acetyltransferase YhbS
MSSNLDLVPLSSDDYIRDVLPHSATMWAYGRTFDDYVADFRALARSAYGKRRFRTVGLQIGNQTVCSCKRYERELHCGGQRLRAVGIGAVFTPPALRGRGYASALLGALLDAERAGGIDVTFLFSNIHPYFYERLGFVALPSRAISIRAASLEARKIEAIPIGDSDWAGVRRCFEALEQRRQFGLRRTPLVWDWLQARRASAPAGRVDLALRRGRTIAAYVTGRRSVRADAYVFEEFGFSDEAGRAAIAPLLRIAAGDLRKVVGWLPPDVARDAVPHGAVKRRNEAILMIVPLSSLARTRWKLQRDGVMRDRADRAWGTDAI